MLTLVPPLIGNGATVAVPRSSFGVAFERPCCSSEGERIGATAEAHEGVERWKLEGRWADGDGVRGLRHRRCTPGTRRYQRQREKVRELACVGHNAPCLSFSLGRRCLIVDPGVPIIACREAPGTHALLVG